MCSSYFSITVKVRLSVIWNGGKYDYIVEKMSGDLLNLVGEEEGRARARLQHMATIDLGSLRLEQEDRIGKSTSSGATDYPSLKIVQRKEYWYKTSPQLGRRASSKLFSLRRCSSMDLQEGQPEEQPLQKLQSETDIQGATEAAVNDTGTEVSDIYVKVPIKT